MPSRLVNVGDGGGRQLEVGRQEDAAPAGVRVLEPDPAHGIGTALPVALAREGDGQVTCDALLAEGRCDRTPLENRVPDSLFHARHKENSL